ncbi:unnamed protein product [Polarella glacialis]|nr:unnamed protein product [Polarella glacialis]
MPEVPQMPGRQIDAACQARPPLLLLLQPATFVLKAVFFSNSALGLRAPAVPEWANEYITQRMQTTRTSNSPKIEGDKECKTRNGHVSAKHLGFATGRYGRTLGSEVPPNCFRHAASEFHPWPRSLALDIAAGILETERHQVQHTLQPVSDLGTTPQTQDLRQKLNR